jgi:hypothetical protein
MSHSRIRVPKPVQRTSPWLTIVGTTTIVVLVGVLAFGKLFYWPSSSSYQTAPGTVLETRMVVDHLRDSPYGGQIYYRIEAHVRYSIEGRQKEQWMTASETTAGREMLAAKLAPQPKNCRVYWFPNHSENAKCQLE